MTEKEIAITAEGLRKIEAELEELKTIHRKEVNDRIRQAKEFGDISENAEYEDAKQEQAFIEGRIMKLEAMIRNAKLIDEGVSADEVHLGSIVKVRNLTASTEAEYTIVGSAEADPLRAKISNESPIGQALMGAKPGTTVTATTPSGDVNLRVVSIRADRRQNSSRRVGQSSTRCARGDSIPSRKRNSNAARP